MKLLLSAGLLNLFLLVPALSATTLYSYNGPNFDTFTNDPPFTSSDHLTIALNLNAPLLPNLSGADISADVVSWTVSAGSMSYGSASGDTIAAATFTTNASGTIVDWYTYLVGGGEFGFISSGDAGDSAFDFVAHGNAWQASTKSTGTWTPSTVTPEPASVLLLALGGGLLLFRYWHRLDRIRS